ncbi:excinuclease ABC subunit B [bacterium]|nr:excinuclease ABC subunit B [bacterium]
MLKQPFKLTADYQAAGDQPAAIAALTKGIGDKLDKQTLLGVTGSGKTHTMAAVIEQTQMPALVISHNKTLAAQLTTEFKEFFPKNAVEYFVSYYDYYQPEAYIPRSDTYISKDSSINDEIDRLRHAAMEAVLTRDDVVVVASVSCIYGLGSPSEFMDMRLQLARGQKITRQDILKQLTRLQYTRNDIDLIRGTFRVRGDVLDIHCAGEDHLLRVEAFGEDIERLVYLDELTGEVIEEVESAAVFPATFFISSPESMQHAMANIRDELHHRIQYFRQRKMSIEAERIAQRTTYDLEMIEQIGYVSGIENYSRHIDGRAPGEPPSTLIDYFRHSYGDDGFLTFIDESHMSIPQLGAMYEGDQARKESLVRFGFRLPSAKDNRPLKFNEFEDRVKQAIFVSATPAEYETNTSQQTVEQIVRPTGLVDPLITIEPTTNQIDHVISAIQDEIKNGRRILVTTLTKRMAEELSTFLVEMSIKAAYLHSDVDTLERLEILRDLRAGTYDVLVGINLLREGLDLPEVGLVAIMDADKEGFLRSRTSMIQTMGRAARHLEGRVVMYADRITGSMKNAMDETDRRRKIQEAYNQKHNITPRSITKKIALTRLAGQKIAEDDVPDITEIPADEIKRAIKELETKMDLAARNLEFEKAAKLRDAIKKLRQKSKRGG